MAALTRIRIDVFEYSGLMRFTNRLGSWVIVEASQSENCRSISHIGKFDAKLTGDPAALSIRLLAFRNLVPVQSLRCRLDPILIEPCKTKVPLVLPIPTPKIRV